MSKLWQYPRRLFQQAANGMSSPNLNTHDTPAALAMPWTSDTLYFITGLHSSFSYQTLLREESPWPLHQLSLYFIHFDTAIFIDPFLLLACINRSPGHKEFTLTLICPPSSGKCRTAKLQAQFAFFAILIHNFNRFWAPVSLIIHMASCNYDWSLISFYLLSGTIFSNFFYF